MCAGGVRSFPSPSGKGWPLESMALAASQLTPGNPLSLAEPGLSRVESDQDPQSG